MNVVAATRLEFTPMREGDLDAVVIAEESIYEFPWTRGNFADSLKANHSLWLCRLGDIMAGYAAMMVAVNDAHLLNLSVLPEYRRRGLGRALLDYLVGLANVYGAGRMLLEVRPSNDSAIDLYVHCGFVEIGRRRGYYAARQGREDAIVMAREL